MDINTFDFLRCDSDIIDHDNVELLNKCKRIARDRIEEPTTEAELIKLRNEARDRASRFWESRQNAYSRELSNYWHRRWEEEDLVYKLLGYCVHELSD